MRFLGNTLRAAFAALMAVTLATACSGSNGSAPALQVPPDSVQSTSRTVTTLSQQATSMSDQNDGIVVLPPALVLPPGATGIFVVASRSNTTYAAVSANPSCATVAPLTIAGQSVDADGNSRVGAFTVGAATGCTTTITVTSGAGGTATVNVKVTGPAPTPSPTPVPTPSPSPTPEGSSGGV